MPIRSDKPPESARKEKIRALRVNARDYPKLPGNVRFSVGAIQGDGTLLDISSSGAHIWRPSKTPPKGVELDLFFLEPTSQRKLHAVGQVVRKTEEGFAVRFIRVERELEKLLLAASGGVDEEAQSED